MIYVHSLIQDINLERLPEELYNTTEEVNHFHERGLVGFSQLMQFTMMLDTLDRLGFNTTNLILYRVIVEQILTDACHWVNIIIEHCYSTTLKKQTHTYNS